VEIFVLAVEDPMQASSDRLKADQLLGEWLAVFLPDTKVRKLQAKGRFVTAVLEAVSMQGIDLILVGTRGARGWDGVFVGSHAEKIVRVSPVPVLTFHQRPRLTGLKNIVVPIDIDSDPAGLRSCLAKLSGLFEGRFHLLYVKTDDVRDEQTTVESLAECGRKLGLAHCINSVVHAEEVAEGILRYADLEGADLIAMGTLGDPDPAHMFRPSVAADIVNHAKIPVFTCQLGHRQVSASH
jgi:nucleotide-binding universal stress UspA family protein